MIEDTRGIGSNCNHSGRSAEAPVRLFCDRRAQRGAAGHGWNTYSHCIGDRSLLNGAKYKMDGCVRFAPPMAEFRCCRLKALTGLAPSPRQPASSTTLRSMRGSSRHSWLAGRPVRRALHACTIYMCGTAPAPRQSPAPCTRRLRATAAQDGVAVQHGAAPASPFQIIDPCLGSSYRLTVVLQYINTASP